jgi:hypothetical protein
VIWLGMTNPRLGSGVVIAGMVSLVYNLGALVFIVWYYRRAAPR